MSASNRIVICDDPYVDWKEGTLQFRLTYEGPLLADTNNGKKVAGRARNKQDIRKAFHPQLRRFWDIHPVLAGEKGKTSQGVILLDSKSDDLEHDVDNLARRFPMGSYNFVPLVTRNLGVHCALDILFLRNDPPRSDSSSGGYR